MENIHFLIKQLSKPQLKMLKTYLQYFSVRKEMDTQLMKFADILLNCDDQPPSIEECSMLIYGKMNYNAIQKLKSRLIKKIENILLLDTGTEKREQGEDELTRSSILIRRKVALFHLLMRKSGNNAVLISEMDEIIRLSKKFEIYSTLIEMLKYRKWMKGFRVGEKVIWEINKEIDFYQRCNLAVNKATDCYYVANIRANFNNKIGKRSFQHFLRDSISDLNEECEATKSPTVIYYTKQLEIMYYDSEDKLDVTREVCLEVLKLITENKSLFRKQRVAIIYDILSNVDMRMWDFEKSARNAQASQRFFPKNSANYNVALSNEFQARFALGEYDKCKSLVTQLLKSTKKEMGDFKYAKFVFFQANVMYVSGKLKEALKLLNLKLKLSQDKQGWDFSVRVLKIQCLLDLGRLDEATNQVVSLIKHAERSSAEEALKPREKLIIRVLRMLEREAFQPGRVKEKLAQFLALFGNNENYAWQPLTSELIPFDKWLAAFYKIKYKKQVLISAGN